MSEREPAEDETILHMPDGEEFLMTRHNARLYTFAGTLATRNHVFLTHEQEDEERAYGTYIFAHNPGYEPLEDFMAFHEYPMILNMNEIQQCDEDAFQNSMGGLSFDEDFIPDDWLDGNA
jgi:hypothetical protein